ncbi:tetratricopeptide repeat protein [Pedobacter nutrimenti]|uniref:Tetratricopeptide repeat protein n=1 Tax=Pedobacter nutrimenti TaxID=1241337 RepID=A0A318U6S0_9SPHI|nr:tetratricopeptide repeat protein [Pedobacter nutrimenti]PYF68993.1 tetratricopeptide repeat protein [Pedobacter nutrimenti]
MKLKSLLTISLFFSLAAKAQTTVQAWEKFFKNDRESSRSMFTKLAAQPQTADEANIGLCLLAEIDKPALEGFTYLNKVYQSSKNPQPYLFALWDGSANYSSNRKSAEQLEFYKGLTERKNTDGALAAMAWSLIGKHQQELKKYDLAKQAYAQLGELENWTITGEYENISTSGFDKTYDVLDHPELSATFTGKRNLKFGWRKVPFTRLDKWFDFSYYNNYKNAIQFAQTFVKSPAAVVAQLRVGVSGSVKVWVNDKLVISEAEERNNDLDSYISSIQLHQGYNRILVQIGESYANRSNFMLRLTDESGRPLNDLNTTTQPQPYVKETSYEPIQIKPAAFAYFEDELKKQPESYLNRLMLAKLYLRQGNIFEARSLLESLKQRFPESTYLNFMMINLFSKAENRTGIETLREAIKTNDPECSIALELLYNEYDQQKDYVNAALMIKKLEKIYGEDEAVLQKKMNIAGKLKNQLEVIALIEKAYPLFPNSTNIVGLKYLYEKEIKKNPQAIAVIEKYLAENDDYTSSKFLAQLYLDKGEAEPGLAIYKKELENDPISFNVYSDLATQYYKLQRYDLAEKTYLQALEIDPNHSVTHAALGQVYDMAKQKAKSIQAYNRSLQINPNNYDAIRSLRRLQEKKPVFDYFTQPDVKALIAAAPAAKDYPDDHIVVLNKEVQKVVYENGGSEEKHFYIAKILTQKGLEASTEYAVSYNSDQEYNIEVAEVIKANGTKVPAEKNDNNIVFTNLEVGDVVNIRYSIENYFVGTMATQFWDSFYFSDGLPYVNSKYSLLIHHDKTFKHVFSQTTLPSVKTRKDEFDLYVWQQSNQKSLSYEDKMPPSDDVTNKLYISSVPNWQFVSDWYNNIATAKARSSYEIKSVIRSLFEGKANLDPLSKVKMIYNYITRNIAYSSVSFRQSGIVPQNPSTVINTRIGDCKDVSTLFVTMCKEAGIEAQLALVSTRDNGQNTLLLPSIDFNHCIAKAIVNKQEYWLELTSGNLPFNTFSNTFINSNILEIGKSPAQLKKFNPELRGRNILNYTTSVTLKDADMIIKEQNQNTGSAASYLRSVFKDLSAKDQLKKMKEQIAALYPENETYSLDFSNLNAETASSDTVGTAASYKLINVSKPVAGMLIFSIPWSSKTAATDLQILSPRKFGIDLTQLFSADESTQQLSLELPEGKSIVQPFKAVSLSNEFVDFSIESVEKDNKIILKRRFVLKNDLVPLDKVEAFKNFYKQMTDADQQQLAMK